MQDFKKTLTMAENTCIITRCKKKIFPQGDGETQTKKSCTFMVCVFFMLKMRTFCFIRAGRTAEKNPERQSKEVRCGSFVC